MVVARGRLYSHTWTQDWKNRENESTERVRSGRGSKQPVLKGRIQDCSGTIACKATASGEYVPTEIRVVVRANKLKKTEIQYKDVSAG